MKKLLLFLLISITSIAQQFPVDCRILLMPPYSGNLADYTASPTKFRVQLLLRDFTKASVDVSLRIRLKGPGVNLENPEGYLSPNAIKLTPGVPVLVSGLELTDNFSIANFEAQGIDLADLIAGTPLPTGSYDWEVMAIETYRNRQVSNLATARMTVSINQPPLLNAPANNSVLTPTAPQNVLFSWTPRHTANPALANGVVYTFFLYEIDDDPSTGSGGVSATEVLEVVNSGLAPYRVIETSNPSLAFGPSEVPLQRGKRYAWQVQVSDLAGKEGFQNNGFSEVHSFKYGDKACPVPTGLRHSIIDEESASATTGLHDGDVVIEWAETPEAQAYELKISTNGEADKTVRLSETKYLQVQSKRAKPYKYALRTICDAGSQSQWTATNTFELKENAWFADSNLTYVKTNSGMADPEPTPDETDGTTNPSTEESTNPETTETEESPYASPDDKAIEGLFSEPITVLVPLEPSSDSTGSSTNTSTTPRELAVLPTNPTVEQLQTALKKQKPKCAGVTASYSCGSHDGVPQYSGSTITVGSGDEIAMNSLIISVVNLDGTGNGRGIITIPMLNKGKVGVTLSGIVVAEGGCIVQGKAEVSDVDVSVLSDAQRQVLMLAHAALNYGADAGIANAAKIAKGINETMAAIENFAKSINEKKRNTRAMLENYSIDKEGILINSCTDISKEGQAMHDSLNKIICLIKSGKIKADLNKLQAAHKANMDFMNTLAPALAECQNKTDWKTFKEEPCKGPCSNLPDVYVVGEKCPTAMKNALGAPNKTNEPLVLMYNKIKHKNGSKSILMLPSENKLTLKNVLEDEPISWEVDGAVVSSSNPLELVFPNGKTKLKVKATQGKRVVEVLVEKLVPTITDFYAQDEANPKRKANNGETLYLVGVSTMKSRGVGYVLKANTNTFNPEDLNWNTTFTTTTSPIPQSGQVTVRQGLMPEAAPLLTAQTWTRTEGIKGSVSVSALNKNYSVEVEVVGEETDKIKVTGGGDSYGDTGKKMLESGKTIDKISNYLGKVPFLKKVNNKSESFGGQNKLTWYFNYTPLDASFKNIEVIDKPTFYRERKLKMSLEAGLKGEAKWLIYGLPIRKFDLPEWVLEEAEKVVKFEINAKAKADLGGEITAVRQDKKPLNKGVYITGNESINPAAIRLKLEVGVEGEFSIGKDLSGFSLTGFASGMAKGEVLSIGYVNQELQYIFGREGLNLDLTAGFKVIIAGAKIELDPYYKRIELLPKNN
jgi:hypothetical protein